MTEIEYPFHDRYLLNKPTRLQKNILHSNYQDVENEIQRIIQIFYNRRNTNGQLTREEKGKLISKIFSKTTAGNTLIMISSFIGDIKMIQILAQTYCDINNHYYDIQYKVFENSEVINNNSNNNNNNNNNNKINNDEEDGFEPVKGRNWKRNKPKDIPNKNIQNKIKIICHQCNEEGHVIRDCPNPKIIDPNNYTRVLITDKDYFVSNEINQINKNKRSALLMAVMNRNYKTVEYLISIGADANNIKSVYTGKFISLDSRLSSDYPLYYAVSKNDHKMTKILVEQGKAAINYHKFVFNRARKFNSKLRSDSIYFSMFVETPLMAALERLDFPMIKYLVEHGADLKLTTETNDPVNFMVKRVLTFRHSKREIGMQILKYLLENGAEGGEWDPSGVFDLPIHFATKRNDVEVVSLLIKHGASLTVGAYFGEHPLDFAINGGRVDVLEILLDHPDVEVSKQSEYLNLDPKTKINQLDKYIRDEVKNKLRNKAKKNILSVWVIKFGESLEDKQKNIFDKDYYYNDPFHC